MPKEINFCIICKKESDTRFCSKECEHIYFKGVSKGEKFGVKIPCDNCHKEIYVTYGGIKNLNHHFCSKLCCNSFRRGKTFEEFYGPERAKELRQKIKDGNVSSLPENKLKNSEGLKLFYKTHPEMRIHLSNKLKGRIDSKETRIRKSEGNKRRYREHPETHPFRIMAKKGRKTYIESIMDAFIRLSGFKKNQYIYQFPVQTKTHTRFVDFAIPSLKLLIECDGEIWHEDKEADMKREQEILESLGKDWRFERMTGQEIFQLTDFFGISRRGKILNDGMELIQN
jgi:very-short-patch-repair endonuclease